MMSKIKNVLTVSMHVRCPLALVLFLSIPHFAGISAGEWEEDSIVNAPAVVATLDNFERTIDNTPGGPVRLKSATAHLLADGSYRLERFLLEFPVRHPGGDASQFDYAEVAAGEALYDIESAVLKLRNSVYGGIWGMDLTAHSMVFCLSSFNLYSASRVFMRGRKDNIIETGMGFVSLSGEGMRFDVRGGRLQFENDVKGEAALGHIGSRRLQPGSPFIGVRIAADGPFTYQFDSPSMTWHKNVIFEFGNLMFESGRLDVRQSRAFPDEQILTTIFSLSEEVVFYYSGFTITCDSLDFRGLGRQMILRGNPVMAAAGGLYLSVPRLRLDVVRGEMDTVMSGQLLFITENALNRELFRKIDNDSGFTDEDVPEVILPVDWRNAMVQIDWLGSMSYDIDTRLLQLVSGVCISQESFNFNGYALYLTFSPDIYMVENARMEGGVQVRMTGEEGGKKLVLEAERVFWSDDQELHAENAILYGDDGDVTLKASKVFFDGASGQWREAGY